ncbi:hypothetical protein [Arthrobacter sp. MYb214]|uniref:hypothetical protein n=1 Tax=Arthrobacter sp. MYb214 TaxID=1848596 RepID=UPI0011B0032E|nr:hypothetical protein [Arthrobacter sp. MYb214]
MNRISNVNARYSAQDSLIRYGVEMLLVSDPLGETLNRTVYNLSRLIRGQNLSSLEDLESAAKALLWRQITRPGPPKYSQGLGEICETIQRQTARFSHMIEDQTLLMDLGETAEQILLADPPLGKTLLESCQEVGADKAVVLAANRPAAQDLRTWLEPLGITVLTRSEWARLRDPFEVTYVIGPPKFFGPSLVTAPVTNELSYILPSWFRDRSIPLSSISDYSEGKIEVRQRLFTVNSGLEVAAKSVENTAEETPELESYLPQAVWPSFSDSTKEPTEDEARARKIYLSGDYSIWLDDGDRIRTVDVGNPPGERVSYSSVKSVKCGTVLLLRQGVSEYGALYDASKRALGKRATEIALTQSSWKQILKKRLNEYSRIYVTNQLKRAGVSTPNRALAWTEENLICPQKKNDFLSLLRWLGIPEEPTFSNAMALRLQTYRTRNTVLKDLEDSVSKANMSLLEKNGFIQIEYTTEGFRGILATRVLAISPKYEIVPKSSLRVPAIDRSAKWLE